MAGNRITAAQLKPFLQECGYRQSLIDAGAALPGGRSAAWTAFAHVPLDARSACISAIDGLTDTAQDALACKELGAPVTFVCMPDRMEWWKQGSDRAVWLETIPATNVQTFFEKNKNVFAPDAIYRAKTWGRVDSHHQLSFVDLGLMPLVEEEAGRRIEQLLVRNVSELKKQLKWVDVTPEQGKWLLQSVFWLLAAKVLRDKEVPKFKNLDLSQCPEVFDLVAEHYGTQERLVPRNSQERSGLLVVAKDIQQFANLNMLTTEALAYVYEQTLISKETRATLGTHSTPTFLVDYVIANLAPWIKEMRAEDRRIFEPACGHAAFLVAGMRLLTELLPQEEATPARRRSYLRARLKGCEIDHFALEIARLSLTLADVPNPNGWDLQLGDMFQGDVLQNGAKNASILLGNPPFEGFSALQQLKINKSSTPLTHLNQSVEVLARTLPALPIGGVFGFVLPQSLLKSADAKAVRELLLRDFELREICLFPDKIFTFSDQESTLILGKKVNHKSHGAHKVLYRRIFKKGLHDFKTRYLATNYSCVKQEMFSQNTDSYLWVPQLKEVWDALATYPRLRQIADIGKGFQFFSRQSHPKTVFWSAKSFPGAVRGFLNLGKSFQSHSLPDEVWLNTSDDAVDVARQGRLTGRPQLLLNSVRVSRGPWRLTATLDVKGHAVTDAFTIIRPQDGYPLEFVWALCNSPIANAFAFTHTHTRHNPIRLLREMPIPNVSDREVRNIATLARDYLDLVDPEKHVPGNLDTAKLLHVTLDAEILKLYGLPAQLESDLLHLFDNLLRVGVPFEQKSYFQNEFAMALSLADYLVIKCYWNKANKRRVRLIDKRINGELTDDEKSELDKLQTLTDIKLEMTTPLPIEELEKNTREMSRRRAALAK